jgi:chemotaxis protein methyltransferase CheR
MTLLAEGIQITEGEFKRLSKLVYDHCGINLHDGKRELVQARVAKRLRGGPFRSVSAYLDHVLADTRGDEFTHLIDAISTNLTSFFREPRHFEFLSQTFLPQLVQRKQKAGSKQILCWSAACSSGEEPYTLAITLREHLPPGDWDVKILATDISTRVLKTAMAGAYPKERLKDVSPQIRGKYFTPGKTATGDVAFTANDSLKGMIRFRHLNLIPAWPFRGPFDFVFCRNVMIYFDKPTQEALVGRFDDVLDKGGLLFTGHSESLTGVRHSFQYVQPTIYAKS